MKIKKSIVIILSLCVFLTSFTSLLTYAQENPKTTKPKLLGKITNEKNLKAKKEPQNITPLNTNNKVGPIKEKEQEIFISGDGEEVVYQGQKKSLSDGTPLAENRYHTGPEEIEEFLNSGFSIADIFQADEIGNKIGIEPKKLLERKKEEQKDLDKIKEEIVKERKRNVINSLKEKFPDVYQQLSTEQLNENDMSTLMAFLAYYDVTSIKQLVDEYKSKGTDAFKAYSKKRDTKPSEQVKNKYGLTDEEAQGLSDETLSKLEIIAAKSNKSVKQVLTEYKDVREKARAGRNE